MGMVKHLIVFMHRLHCRPRFHTQHCDDVEIGNNCWRFKGREDDHAARGRLVFATGSSVNDLVVDDVRDGKRAQIVVIVCCQLRH